MTPQIVHRLELDQVAELRKVARRAHWQDGSSSARGAAAEVKRCSSSSVPMDGIVAPILQSVLDAPRMRRIALPRRATPFRLVRYSAGDYYGPHADIIANPSGFRCDFSLTIMVQRADAGGRFLIGNDPRSTELEPGECMIYPATTVHQVLPVESGERVVIIAWLESFVRELERRQLLAELEQLGAGELEPTPARLEALRQELLRQWMS